MLQYMQYADEQIDPCIERGLLRGRNARSGERASHSGVSVEPCRLHTIIPGGRILTYLKIGVSTVTPEDEWVVGIVAVPSNETMVICAVEHLQIWGHRLPVFPHCPEFILGLQVGEPRFDRGVLVNFGQVYWKNASTDALRKASKRDQVTATYVRKNIWKAIGDTKPTRYHQV